LHALVAVAAAGVWRAAGVRLLLARQVAGEDSNHGCQGSPELPPKEYGKGGRRCRTCANQGGIIRRYGINMCRQCFRTFALDIGFQKVRDCTQKALAGSSQRRCHLCQYRVEQAPCSKRTAALHEKRCSARVLQACTAHAWTFVLSVSSSAAGLAARAAQHVYIAIAHRIPQSNNGQQLTRSRISPLPAVAQCSCHKRCARDGVGGSGGGGGAMAGWLLRRRLSA
jgi:small subunit ribosomal protein S29e